MNGLTDHEEEAAARAQAWLFFGLLKEIFGEKAQQSRFIRAGDDDGKWLTLHVLPIMTRRFTRNDQWRVQPIIYDLLRPFLANWLFGMLGPIWDYLWKICLVQPFAVSPPEVRTALIETQNQIDRLEKRFPVSESVNLTCLAIRGLVWSIRNAIANDDPTIFKRSCFQLSSSTYLHRVLLQREFCPHELDALQTHCSIPTLHYLSAFTYDLKAHETCSREACRAYILNDVDYVTRHTEQSCNCDFAKVGEVLVQQIIQ